MRRITLKVLSVLCSFVAIAMPVEAVDLHLPGYSCEHVFVPPLQTFIVDVGPADQIVVCPMHGDALLRVYEDGSIEEYASPSAHHHSGIAFDPAGQLYVADWWGDLWRIPADLSQRASKVASGLTGGLALDCDLAGNVYSVGWESTEVQKITPLGAVSTFANGLSANAGKDVAVDPTTGLVYVADWEAASIFRVNLDGSLSLLVDGLTTDNNYIDFNSDGTLYHMSIYALSAVSTADGSRTELSWLEDKSCMLVPKDIAFDSAGRIIAIDHTFNNVVRIDPASEALIAIHVGLGNSWALTRSPASSAIYLGASHPSVDGEGQILEIMANGSVSDFVSGLLPGVHSIVFNAAGFAFISAMRGGPGGYQSTIYTVPPFGTAATLTVLGYVAHSLAIDPSTQFLWGTGWREVWYLDELGVHHSVPCPADWSHWGSDNVAFLPDGSLYLFVATGDPNVQQVEQGLYRIDDPYGVNPTFTLVTDLTTLDLSSTMGVITGANDGHIYWAGWNDRYTPDNDPDMHILRISPAGGVTLFATDLGMDPAGIASDPESDDLWFNGGAGVYRIRADTNATFRTESTGDVLADGTFHGQAFASGGADIAERVLLTGNAEAGDVLEVDPANPRSYRVTSSPYSALVAGVVSNEPGIVLGESIALDQWALLALTGIVPVKVTDEGGPIQPGDLLVSSSTLGHAMRWSGPDPCPCALVGKALEPMTEDRALILVLLTAH